MFYQPSGGQHLSQQYAVSFVVLFYLLKKERS
nr:MAG TPA: hypothetical protein [Caudoviricetes sp.]